MAIPNNPAVGDEYTNDNTGVTYKWDGERWYIVSTEAADNAATYVTKTDFIDDQQRQDDLIEDISGEFSIRRSYQINRTQPSDNGLLTTNSTTPSSVTTMAFGVLDIGGRNTPALKVGDKIRVTNVTSNNSNDYTVTEVKNTNHYGVSALTNIGSWDENDNCSVLFTGTTGGDSSLAARVTEGEETQAQIQTTIATSIETQQGIDRQSVV